MVLTSDKTTIKSMANIEVHIGKYFLLSFLINNLVELLQSSTSACRAQEVGRIYVNYIEVKQLCIIKNNEHH